MARRGNIFSAIADNIRKRGEAKRERKMLKLTARLDRKAQKQDRKDQRLDYKYDLKNNRLDKRERTQALRIHNGVDIGSVVNKNLPHVTKMITENVKAGSSAAVAFLNAKTGGGMSSNMPGLELPNLLNTKKTLNPAITMEKDSTKKFDFKKYAPWIIGGVVSAIVAAVMIFKKPKKRRRR